MKHKHKLCMRYGIELQKSQVKLASLTLYHINENVPGNPVAVDDATAMQLCHTVQYSFVQPDSVCDG
jgi:hypothetical protein